jgi:hypothetical protein
MVVEATVVHHTEQHKGNPTLFWDATKFASSCKSCHDIVEQGIEARGYEVGCDASGRPIGADHPWNAR